MVDYYIVSSNYLYLLYYPVSLQLSFQVYVVRCIFIFVVFLLMTCLHPMMINKNGCMTPSQLKKSEWYYCVMSQLMYVRIDIRINLVASVKMNLLQSQCLANSVE